MNVLVVGMRKDAVDTYAANVARGIIGCNYGKLDLLSVETFNGAMEVLNTGMPDILHLVNEVGFERLRYAHGCEQMGQVFDQVARKPLVNVQQVEMLNYLRPIFDRRRMPPRLGDLPDAIRVRLAENRLYRRKAS